MRKRRFSRTARLLIALGAVLQIAALLAFSMGDALLQYAICAPDVQTVTAADGSSHRETGLEQLIDAREDVFEQLGDGLAALACGGIKGGASVSGGGNSTDAALQAVDLCWLETCPRRILDGRWMDASELKSGAQVTVLDADLAFDLFGSESALERTVRILDKDYRVIGTVKHRRSVGERDACSAYVPLSAVAAQGVQLDTLTMYALPLAQTGMDQSFTAAMRNAWGAGSFYSLRREAMGGMLLSRLLLCALVMALLWRLTNPLRGLAKRFRGEIAGMQRHGYLKSYLLPSLARIFALILCAAAWLAAVYGVLCVAIEPVYTFTEWIPESLVELSALRAVFWSRAEDAAQLVKVITPEAARSAFWGSAARLGAVLTLLGLALGRGRSDRSRAPQSAEN